MPVRKTAAGGYEVTVSVRGRRLHRRLPPGTSAGAARQVEAQLVTALGKGEPNIPGNPRLLDIMALYTQNAEKELRSPDTAMHHAARIGPWLEGRRAEDARKVASAIVRDMRGHYAAGTINRSLGTLKRALKLAWEAGHTHEDFSARVKRLPENNQRTVYLSMEQVKAIADRASENVRTAIWVSLLTGCRRGEVLKVTEADIGRNTIRIQAGNTKTLRYREVPIVPALRPWLKNLPLPINYEGVKSGFRRAREAAEVPHVHFHDLRHSCATIMLKLGVPLEVVRDILGHTTVKTTERYAHVMIE
jgi:integrase